MSKNALIIKEKIRLFVGELRGLSLQEGEYVLEETLAEIRCLSVIPISESINSKS